MLDKKLTADHLCRPVYLNVKGECEVRGILLAFEYSEREFPREARHPLMGSVPVKGVELHIGNKIYFVREDAPDVALVFM